MIKKFTLMLAFVMAFQMVNAQNPGDLDPTFGTNGIVQTAIGDDSFLVDALQNLTVQPDGKILAVGSSREGSQKRMAFVRYNQDGSLDNTFGDNGIVIIIPSQAYGNFIMQSEILDDGKILSCARIYDPNQTIATSVPVMVKMNNDGSMDETFGNNGLIIYDMGQNNVCPMKMSIQDDGKILYTGYYNNDIVVIRFNTDGSMDTSYGNNGVCQIPINGYASNANDMTLQEDGKAIIVGNCYEVIGDQPLPKWAIVRLNTDGTLDNTFAGDGILTMSVGEGNDYATAVKVQNDGKILVGGNSWDQNNPVLKYSCAVVRLNTDGSMDESFANNGLFRARYLDDAENYVIDIAVAQDNNIYVGYQINHQWNNVNAMGVLCLTPDGILNSEFGEGGYCLVDLESTDTSMAIELQADGKVLLGGECFGANSTGSKFTVARILTNAAEQVIGDVNDNGTVDVTDVTAVVAYIMELNPQPFNVTNADCNTDGTIDILDIMYIVNIIMQK